MDRQRDNDATGWHDAQVDLPDADTTVLVFTPIAASDPVWPGWYDGENWHYADGFPAYGVTHWMHFPEPPESMQ